MMKVPNYISKEGFSGVILPPHVGKC